MKIRSLYWEQNRIKRIDNRRIKSNSVIVLVSNPIQTMSQNPLSVLRVERHIRNLSSKSSITVKLENLNITVNGTKATVKFRQDYKANGLAVSSKKVLELTKNGDHWHIAQEAVAK